MIYVVMHKIVESMNDDLYRPLLVGSYNKKTSNILRDDQGENISKLNENFCELTGLYWIWKNCNEDIVGLCHYRRYLSKKFFSNDSKYYLNSKDIENDFKNGINVILPKKEFCKKKIKDNFKTSPAPNEEDMEYTKNVLKKLFPEYLPDYEKYENSHSSYLCNVIVCKKEILSEYCEWLFKILFELQKEMPLENYINDSYRKRMFGFISERLLNVWVIHNIDRINVKEYYLIKTDDSKIKKIQYALKQTIKRMLYKN